MSITSDELLHRAADLLQPGVVPLLRRPGFVHLEAGVQEAALELQRLLGAAIVRGWGLLGMIASAEKVPKRRCVQHQDVVHRSRRAHVARHKRC